MHAGGRGEPVTPPGVYVGVITVDGLEFTRLGNEDGQPDRRSSSPVAKMAVQPRSCRAHTASIKSRCG